MRSVIRWGRGRMRKALYIGLFIFFLIFILPFVLFFFAFDSSPVIKTQVVSNALHAKRTREIIKELQSIAVKKSGTTQVQIFENELEGMIAVAGRAIPDLRGKASVRKDDLRIAISGKVPKLTWLGWMNVSVSLTSSKKGVKFTSLKVGPYPLPSSLIMPVGGFVLDRMLGDGLGQVIVQSIGPVTISHKRAVVDVTISHANRKKIARRLKSQARSFAGVGNPKDVRAYYIAIDNAARKKQFPARGSFVPYLKFALDLSLQRSRNGKLKEEKQAALLALAIYCGHKKFEKLIGNTIHGRRGWRTHCAKNTLAGRGDLRAHFIISAGLKAASDAGFAFAIGEFKELLDSNKGGSGFSFDDLAADRAGIRFAEVVLNADSNELSGIVNKLSTEKVLFPSIKGLPAGLSRQQFEKNYGNVDSVAYKKILNEIESRLDNLELYKDTDN